MSIKGGSSLCTKLSFRLFLSCNHLEPSSGTFVTYGELFQQCNAGLSSLHWTILPVNYAHGGRHHQCIVSMRQVQDPEQLQSRWPPPSAVHWMFRLWWNPHDYQARKAPNFQSLLEFVLPRQRNPEDFRQRLLPNLPQLPRQLQALQLPRQGRCAPRGPSLFST